MKTKVQTTGTQSGRLMVVLCLLGFAMGVLLWRSLDLHVFNRDFLQQQGDARHLRVVPIAAHRGMITDRHGEPLAISTPVDSIWANPGLLAESRDQWPQLASLLGMEVSRLERLLAQRMEREFVYLRRHVNPELVQQVMSREIPGVSLQREYRRYYPTSEVFSHVVGFTNVDDIGLEGMELAYNEWLRGVPGSKRVIKDRIGNIVDTVESISEPRPGKDLRLSLDRRLQYLAYRELKAAVQQYQAKAGSLVLLDATTGEVLAMVNQPAYNPHSLKGLKDGRSRNRAVTDVFEPGSSIKPFTIAAALESGRFRSESAIDTSPGFLRVGSSTVRDVRNFGAIDVSTVIQKSSNVGASLISLALEPQYLWETLTQVGFGASTGSGFPGESSGLLNYRERWRDIERATLSYGYGLSVTPMQLAQGYTSLGGDGLLRSVSFLPVNKGELVGVQALKPETSRAVLSMLERVVRSGGTGTKAQVPGYRIAGKTGTVKKATRDGYSNDNYLSVFVGMAPASKPRLIMSVVVDDPKGQKYYGGDVAAPVFSKVMAGALRLLDIPPDNLGTQLAGNYL
ncbi:MAG: penicillin-binding protein 2 [Gammaproteobacteria bacterium]|nr:penicillin-binding protein 2 [Gammaproteobacteria bacterium]